MDHSNVLGSQLPDLLKEQGDMLQQTAETDEVPMVAEGWMNASQTWGVGTDGTKSMCGKWEVMSDFSQSPFESTEETV